METQLRAIQLGKSEFLAPRDQLAIISRYFVHDSVAFHEFDHMCEEEWFEDAEAEGELLQRAKSSNSTETETGAKLPEPGPVSETAKAVLEWFTDKYGKSASSAAADQLAAWTLDRTDVEGAAAKLRLLATRASGKGDSPILTEAQLALRFMGQFSKREQSQCKAYLRAHVGLKDATKYTLDAVMEYFRDTIISDSNERALQAALTQTLSTAESKPERQAQAQAAPSTYRNNRQGNQSHVASLSASTAPAQGYTHPVCAHCGRRHPGLCWKLHPHLRPQPRAEGKQPPREFSKARNPAANRAEHSAPQAAQPKSQQRTARAHSAIAESDDSHHRTESALSRMEASLERFAELLQDRLPGSIAKSMPLLMCDAPNSAHHRRTRKARPAPKDAATAAGLERLTSRIQSLCDLLTETEPANKASALALTVGPDTHAPSSQEPKAALTGAAVPEPAETNVFSGHTEANRRVTRSQTTAVKPTTNNGAVKPLPFTAVDPEPGAFISAPAPSTARTTRAETPAASTAPGAQQFATVPASHVTGAPAAQPPTAPPAPAPHAQPITNITPNSVSVQFNGVQVSICATPPTSQADAHCASHALAVSASVTDVTPEGAEPPAPVGPREAPDAVSAAYLDPAISQVSINGGITESANIIDSGSELFAVSHDEWERAPTACVDMYTPNLIVEGSMGEATRAMPKSRPRHKIPIYLCPGTPHQATVYLRPTITRSTKYSSLLGQPFIKAVKGALTYQADGSQTFTYTADNGRRYMIPLLRGRIVSGALLSGAAMATKKRTHAELMQELCSQHARCVRLRARGDSLRSEADGCYAEANACAVRITELTHELATFSPGAGGASRPAQPRSRSRSRSRSGDARQRSRSNRSSGSSSSGSSSSSSSSSSSEHASEDDRDDGEEQRVTAAAATAAAAVAAVDGDDSAQRATEAVSAAELAAGGQATAPTKVATDAPQQPCGGAAGAVQAPAAAPSTGDAAAPPAAIAVQQPAHAAAKATTTNTAAPTGTAPATATASLAAPTQQVLPPLAPAAPPTIHDAPPSAPDLDSDPSDTEELQRRERRRCDAALRTLLRHVSDVDAHNALKYGLGSADQAETLRERAFKRLTVLPAMPDNVRLALSAGVACVLGMTGYTEYFVYTVHSDDGSKDLFKTLGAMAKAINTARGSSIAPAFDPSVQSAFTGSNSAQFGTGTFVKAIERTLTLESYTDSCCNLTEVNRSALCTILRKSPSDSAERIILSLLRDTKMLATHATLTACAAQLINISATNFFVAVHDVDATASAAYAGRPFTRVQPVGAPASIDFVLHLLRVRTDTGNVIYGVAPPLPRAHADSAGASARAPRHSSAPTHVLCAPCLALPPPAAPRPAPPPPTGAPDLPRALQEACTRITAAARAHAPASQPRADPPDNTDAPTFLPLPRLTTLLCSEQPVIVLDFQANIGERLAALLRCTPVHIRSYSYFDSRPVHTDMARQHVALLSAAYDARLAASAVAAAFEHSALTIQEYLGSSMWHAFDSGAQLILFAPPCPAALQVAEALACRGARPLVILSGPAPDAAESSAAAGDRADVANLLGAGIAVDPTRMGSGVHSIQQLWTNGAPRSTLAALLRAPRRSPDLTLLNILADTITGVANADEHDKLPYYLCNIKGAPLSALPALTAERPFGRPVLYDALSLLPRKATPEEIERAIGLFVGATAAPAATALTRAAALRAACDVHAVGSLLHAIRATHQHMPSAFRPRQPPAPSATAGTVPAFARPTRPATRTALTAGGGRESAGTNIPHSPNIFEPLNNIPDQNISTKSTIQSDNTPQATPVVTENPAPTASPHKDPKFDNTTAMLTQLPSAPAGTQVTRKKRAGTKKKQAEARKAAAEAALTGHVSAGTPTTAHTETAASSAQHKVRVLAQRLFPAARAAWRCMSAFLVVTILMSFVLVASQPFEAARCNPMLCGDSSTLARFGAVKDLVVNALSATQADTRQRPPDNGTRVPGQPDFRWKVNPDLPSEIHDEFIHMLNTHTDCFAFDVTQLGRFDKIQFRIQLKNKENIKHSLYIQQYRNLSQAEQAIIAKQCDELYRAGMIEPSSQTDYAAPTVLPPKKDEAGNWTDRRMCGDYRKMNDSTVADPYIMPTAEEIFDALGDSSIFSKLDLFKGYNQIVVAEEDRPKTAFWGGKQLWQWKVMPFGLKNAGACFQRCMDYALRGLRSTHAYIDDCIVHGTKDTTASMRKHIADTARTLEQLHNHGLRCHPGKSHFGYFEVEFLGHTVSEQGIAPVQSKVDAVLKIPEPKTVSELRSFLGLANYYRRCIKDFSIVAQPLNQLLRKEARWAWGSEQQAAFDTLKHRLTSAEVLTRPDFNKPFIVQTDWSVHGMGAILAQKDAEGRERVIAYASKSNTPAEAKYSSYKGELLAVVWACKHWRRYLIGQHFTIVTDHQPLNWLMHSNELTGQYARWALSLQEFDFTVVHRPGSENPNADAFSRAPDSAVTHPAEPIAEACDTLPPYAPLPGGGEHGGAGDPLRAAAANYFSGCAVYVPTGLPPPHFPSPCRVLAAHAARATGAAEPAHTAVVLSATVAALQPQNETTTEIWEDTPCLDYLQTGQHAHNISDAERDRIVRKAAGYRWKDGRLLRIMSNQSTRIVPPPSERPALVKRVHEQYGHFGVTRTVNLLQLSYWWRSMWPDVAAIVRNCSVCDREKAGFNIRPATLNPLAIRGPGYRWHVDLAGPLPESVDGYLYVMICIEAFTKWVEIIPLRDKLAATTWHAFLTHVLARFGACAEVVTDQGTEFEGEFDEGLVSLAVDHRRTSRNHPQADGLAERCVQTIKACIRRCAEKDITAWPLALPWIAMGYRFSPQASLRVSPYYALYARKPVVPPAIRERFTSPLRFDDPEAVLDSVIDRATLLKHVMPMALDNLAIAQRRDTLRYATVRSGGYRPAVHDLAVGDYVYIRAPASQDSNTLSLAVNDEIYRVVELLPTGVARLQGKDGRTMPENVRNLAPCHLSTIDGTVDPTLAHPDVDTIEIPCEICNSIEHNPQDRVIMLLCDHCNTGWHLHCMGLTTKPKGDWFCPYCVRLQRTWKTVISASLCARRTWPALMSAVAARVTRAGDLGPPYPTPPAVLAALHELMPGPWTQAHATRLYNRMPGRKHFTRLSTGGPERVLTTAAEYDPLLWHVDMTGVSTAWDPWCGTGTTALRLSECSVTQHVHTVMSDVDPSVGADHYGDALDPRFLQTISALYNGVDVFITSPWFTMLDLAIPLMDRAAKRAVFCHIPGHYLTNMPAARREWFRRNASRLLIISNLPIGPFGRRCAWLCVFASAAIKRQMTRRSFPETPDASVTIPVIV